MLFLFDMLAFESHFQMTLRIADKVTQDGRVRSLDSPKYIVFCPRNFLTEHMLIETEMNVFGVLKKHTLQ